MSTQIKDLPLLDRIDSPEDLRGLSPEQLEPLAEEIRHFMIDSVSRTGGHLAPSLGTVELTIALHYVFNTPDDRLVWDVGHQAYAHKILTGRRAGMAKLRQAGGLSGFPKRSESDYDAFGVGHSSTSIGAALGMAVANAEQHPDRRAVAVIGDGAMTAGMAFEALNHAGDLEANLLVVLNDNEMSISRNVGGLSNHLARILSGRLYSTMREGSKKVLARMPSVWELARRAEEHMKGMVIPGTLFEELGFNYIGPVDGHDMGTLVSTLKNLRSLKGPQFLHVVTRKGKGYPPAEDNPKYFHGVAPFDRDSGEPRANGSGGPTYTQVFGQWLCDMAAQDERLMGITPAMCSGSGLTEFKQQYPKRFFDVGIAEQHAVTFAAGLACEGTKPVVAIYSTFMQRAYDQIIHDVAIQNLPVLFAVDRAGLVGPDGANHDGIFDLSYMRCIPNLVIMTPADEAECRQMLTTGYEHQGPAMVRYPRGKGPGTAVPKDLSPLPLGRGEWRRKGQQVALLVFGAPLAEALAAAEEIDASVANMRFVKPMDRELVLEAAKSHRLLITVEENTVQGGAGSAVAEILAEAGIHTPIRHLGLPDRFQAHGDRQTLLHDSGLSARAILQSVQAYNESAGG